MGGQAAVICEETGPFVYPHEAYTSGTAKEDEEETVENRGGSIFYKAIRALSTLIALGFIVLLVLSLATGGPIHWSIAIVGCLGGVGLSGAIWLSKS
jgi:hypothetical protein